MNLHLVRREPLLLTIVLLLGACLSPAEDQSIVSGNQAPTISGTPGTTIETGAFYSFIPSANDTDGDTLRFEIQGIPAWASFDNSTGALTGSPIQDDVGTDSAIVISVTDGDTDVSLEPFSITVIDAGTAGPPPSGQYIGFGSATNGAGSCPDVVTTYRVTSLSGDNGNGTLRDAVSANCRHIVFDVAGDIDFGGGSLFISKSYLTIDGSSAPAPGITLINVNQLKFEARVGPAGPPFIPVHDIIVNNIRAVGAGGRNTFVAAADLWELDGSSGWPDGVIYNIVLDHITTDGAGNGNAEIYGLVHDVTVSNSFFHDSIQGQHMSMAGGLRERITYYGNVYAHISERQPRMRYANRQVDYVGNVIYGWGYTGGDISDCNSAGWNINTGSGSMASGNFEWNVYHYRTLDLAEWPGACGRENDAIKLESVTDSAFYLSNNSWPAGERDVSAASTSATRIDMVYQGIDYAAPRMAADILNAGTHSKTAEERQLLQEIVQGISE